MNIVVKKSIVSVAIAGCVLALSCELAKAAVITQWTFNSSTPSSGTSATSGGTGATDPGNSPRPTTGTGTALTLGMTNPYNNGNQAADDYLNTTGTAVPSFGEYLWRVRANPTFADGTANRLPNNALSANGWAIYNISPGTANGAPQYSQGVELDTSTVGYSNVQFSFDWYSTTQGIRDMQFQYNLDTSNSAGWTNIGAAIGSAAIGSNFGGGALQGSSTNYVFIATPNDFFGGSSPQNINVNLSSITGANNNPNFGVRLVAAFDDTSHLNPNDYASATLNGGQTQLYNNSSGNWRFGSLTFSGKLTLNTSFSGGLTWNTGSGTWDTNSSNTVWLDSGSNAVAYSNGSVANVGDVSSGTSAITVTSSGVVAAGIAINNTVPGTGYSFAGGAISGTGAFYLQPTNVGFVSLTGTNTYSGGTQISGGTLIVSGDPSLGSVNGASGAVVIDNGSTLQLATALSSSRLFEIGSNGGVIDTQGLSFTSSGSFVAGGSYTQLGAGTVSMSGLSVQLSGSATIPAGGALVLNGTNGASLQGGATFNGNLVIGQAERVNFDNGGTSGTYGGSGQILVPVSSKNAWPVLSNSPTGSATAADGVVVSGGTISNNIVLNSNNVAFTKTDVTQTFALASSNAFLVGFGGTTPGSVLAFTGNISGSSDVVLGSNSTLGSGGAGTTFLSGSNSYSGTTLIDGNGVVKLGSTTALPPQTDVIFGGLDTSSATLDVNGFSQSINSLSASKGTSAITNSSLSGATLTITGNITPKTAYNGSITGPLALYKSGTGSLSLSGSSNYTGATTIAQGTVTVSRTSALGVGPLALQSGANLIYSGSAVSLANSGASMVAGATLSTGGTANYGTLSLNNFNLSGGSVTYDFNTTQSDLIKGSGVLDLSLASSKSIVVNLNIVGQTFNSYPLFSFGSLNGFNAADFTLGSGTTAGYTYGFVQDAQNSNQIDLTVSGSGVINRQSLAWATSSGNWNTTAVNWTVLGTSATATYSDGESVTFGEPTANNSVVTITGTSVTPLSLTFSNSSRSYTITGGSIAGTTSLAKSGAGLVTLASPNTYSGGTFITGGTLATGAAGDAALGAGTAGITIDTNGTLQFTTGVSGSRAVAVGAGGGTIVASTGTATMGGNLNIAANGSFTSAGTGTLNFTKNVTSGTGSTISVQSGTLALVPENFTDGGQLNVANGATLLMLTQTSTGANSGSVKLGSTTLNGNLVVTNPLGVKFSTDITGSGNIQFQNMYTPPAPTHFTNATGQQIQVSGGPNVTVSVANNIQLNSLNSTFIKTSISQSGAAASGNGFILGDGTTCSLFTIDPGANNTMNVNGAISGNCDVQLGPLGGGGQTNTIYFNNQNTYSGVTIFSEGVLGNVILGTSNALPTTTDLMFAPINGNGYQQKLDLNGNNQTVASLSYWAYANTDAFGDGYSTAIQVVNGNNSVVATLTVSGATTPSRPYGGVIGDTGNQNLILVKDGPNTLWLNGGNSSYGGGTIVKNGMLLLSPTGATASATGDGGVTVTGGTLQGTANILGSLIVGSSGTVHPGLFNSLVSGGTAAPGALSVANSATISGGAKFQYDFGSGTSSSLLSVASALTLPTSGHATINLTDLGGLSGIVPLMTYGLLGNSFSTSQLAIGTSPDGAGAYAFRSTGSTAASGEIDLIAPTKLIWTGSLGTAWNTNSTANFTSANDPEPMVFNGNLASYGVKDHVTFNDIGSGGTVAIANVGVAPLSVVFSNSSKSYDLTGGPITGSTSLVVSGGGQVTLSNTNSYTGGTFVNSGTLVVDSPSAIASGTNLTVGSSTTLFNAPTVPGGIEGAAVAVPEPGTLALLAAGIAVAAFRVARRRK
jgi:autotransporter-associated beta strand protein